MSTRVAVTGPIATVRDHDVWALPLRDRVAASVAAYLLGFTVVAVAVVLATVSAPNLVVDRLGLVLTIGGAGIVLLAVMIGIPLQITAGHSRPGWLRFSILTLLAVVGVSALGGVLAFLVFHIAPVAIAATIATAVLCALISLPLLGPLSRRPALTYALVGVALIAVAGVAVLGMLS